MKQHRVVGPPEAVRARAAAQNEEQATMATVGNAPVSEAMVACGKVEAPWPFEDAWQRVNGPLTGQNNSISDFDTRVASGVSPEDAAAAALTNNSPSFGAWAAYVTEAGPDRKPLPGRLTQQALAQLTGMSRSTLGDRIRRHKNAGPSPDTAGGVVPGAPVPEEGTSAADEDGTVDAVIAEAATDQASAHNTNRLIEHIEEWLKTSLQGGCSDARALGAIDGLVQAHRAQGASATIRG